MPTKQALAYKRGKRDACIENNDTKTEHCPPTWAAVIAIFCEAYRNTGDTKHLAEVIRCAQLADKYVAQRRSETPTQAELNALLLEKRTLLPFAEKLLATRNNGTKATEASELAHLAKTNPDLVRLLALAYVDLRVHGMPPGTTYTKIDLANYDDETA